MLLASLSMSCVILSMHANQLRTTVFSHSGARFDLFPLSYRLITITAMITERDVIVITVVR